MRRGRQAAQGNRRDAAARGRRLRRRQHVRRAGCRGVSAGLWAGGWLGSRHGRDSVLAHRGDGFRAAAAAERGAARVRAGQPDLRQRQPLRGPALPSRRRRAAHRDAGLRSVDGAAGGERDERCRRASAALGATMLPTIAVCDVDLAHQSHISDEEELRFQMGVAVYGYERDQHNGGTAYRWGEQVLHHRRACGCDWSMSVRSRAISAVEPSSATPSARSAVRACRRSHPIGSGSTSRRSHQERCGRSRTARRLLRRCCGGYAFAACLCQIRRQRTACSKPCASPPRRSWTCTWTTSRSW